jgi:hypothetical protein
VPSINQLNDNYDYFYVKRPDASRLADLELRIFSLNSVTTCSTAPASEHIAGIPATDAFCILSAPTSNQVPVARSSWCEQLLRWLLGDMRAYNYVTWALDFEDERYRAQTIDFDQQCYEAEEHVPAPVFPGQPQNRAAVRAFLLKPNHPPVPGRGRALSWAGGPARSATASRPHRNCLRRDTICPRRVNQLKREPAATTAPNSSAAAAADDICRAAPEPK